MKKFFLLLLAAFAAGPARAEDPAELPVYTASSAMDFWNTNPTRQILLSLAKDAEEKAIQACLAAGHPSCVLAEISSLECAPLSNNGIEGLRCLAQAAASPDAR